MGTQRFFCKVGQFCLKSSTNLLWFYWTNWVYLYDILHSVLLWMMYKFVWYILTNSCGKKSFLITTWTNVGFGIINRRLACYKWFIILFLTIFCLFLATLGKWLVHCEVITLKDWHSVMISSMWMWLLPFVPCQYDQGRQENSKAAATFAMNMTSESTDLLSVMTSLSTSRIFQYLICKKTTNN